MTQLKTTAASPSTIDLPSDQNATGRTFGDEEIRFVTESLNSGTLTSTKGSFTKTFERSFADLLTVKHAYACSSGTAAIHIAVAAIDPEPGDEIITTPITDMGGLTPILYQGAIPVFADVDPETFNVTAETIAARISERTKAIIVTHLFGKACPMEEIMELANSRGIPVIEDCAQAFLTTSNNELVGTIGTIGCFSLQQGKHITTGEGGLVCSNDEELARRMFLFINKAWGYGDDKPDHYFLALNYRISELQGAVALGQLPKLTSVVDRRIASADSLTAKIADLPGLTVPRSDPSSAHTYWKYALRVDSQVIPGGAVALAAKLKTRGIASAPRYIQKPSFMCAVFQKRRTFGKSEFPFTLARPEALDYSPERFPGTYAALESVLVLPWNEAYTPEHVDFIATALREEVEGLVEEAR